MSQLLSVLINGQHDLKVIGSTSTYDEGLKVITILTPDIVIMDVKIESPGIPSRTGIDLTREITSLFKKIKIIGLSGFVDKCVIEKMFLAGAKGFVCKTAPIEAILRGLRDVNSGKTFLCQESAKVISTALFSMNKNRETLSPIQLSPRETEVLELLANGNHSRSIAATLHISIHTVDVHRRNIMEKLDIHNSIDLTHYAIRTGLVSA